VTVDGGSNGPAPASRKPTHGFLQYATIDGPSSSSRRRKEKNEI